MKLSSKLQGSPLAPVCEYRLTQHTFAACFCPGARSRPGLGLDVHWTWLYPGWGRGGCWAHGGLLCIPGGPSPQICLMLLGIYVAELMCKAAARERERRVLETGSPGASGNRLDPCWRRTSAIVRAGRPWLFCVILLLVLKCCLRVQEQT